MHNLIQKIARLKLWWVPTFTFISIWKNTNRCCVHRLIKQVTKPMGVVPKLSGHLSWLGCTFPSTKWWSGFQNEGPKNGSTAVWHCYLANKPIVSSFARIASQSLGVLWYARRLLQKLERSLEHPLVRVTKNNWRLTQNTSLRRRCRTSCCEQCKSLLYGPSNR